MAGAARQRYVELFRNIPLLVQMFLWYFVLPEVLPQALGDWLKQMPPPWRSTPAVLCLGFFTSARVAEQVAPASSLPRGQGMAGTGDRPDAAADLSLRAAADGVPHHPAAAHAPSS